MAILGPHRLTLHSPVCDWLDATIPIEDGDVFRREFEAIGVELGGDNVSPDLWRFPALVMTDLGTVAVSVPASAKHGAGTVTFQRFGQVLRVSASGSVLASMRVAGLYDRYLSLLGQFPHNITRLDACADVPEHSPPRIRALYEHAVVQGNGVKLGRKHTPGRKCRGFLGLSARDELTGTVYIGSRRGSEISACCYDKRHQLESWGLGDIGRELQRSELRFSGQVGCTLRDAHQPGAVFWNYSGALLDPPSEFKGWNRGDTGFDMVRPPPLDPIVAIQRACERSTALHTLIRFADRIGVSRRHLWSYMGQVVPLPAVQVAA